MIQESNETTSKVAKIAIVGVGGVGSTLAYALLISGIVSDVVLVAPDRSEAEAEAADLNHAGPFTPAGRARAGDYADIKGALLTVLTTDIVPENLENSTLAAAANVAANVEAFRDMVPRIMANNPSGLLVVASNPIELLTRLTLEISGLPSGRVLGAGTILDSAWLTFFLSERFGVDERSVEALVLGIHGKKGIPIWSSCRVGAMPVETFATTNDFPFNEDEFSHLFTETVHAGEKVSRSRSNSSYGRATSLLKIIEAVVRDANVILPIVTRPDEDTAEFYASGETALSLPCVVNRQGVRRALRMPLHDQENAALRIAAEHLESDWASLTQQKLANG
jgi:L-lactate dehydrogenase